MSGIDRIPIVSSRVEQTNVSANVTYLASVQRSCVRHLPPFTQHSLSSLHMASKPMKTHSL